MQSRPVIEADGLVIGAGATADAPKVALLKASVVAAARLPALLARAR